ncbi:MAG: iron-sulfur cluster assembly accessory protein [Gammaproteobacteria bacterium]|nr:iron-sulfur cluster assembly accessory protein [Gammaproteobacteria bacterium]
MITITPEAAEQIKTSAEQGNLAGMPLRLAVTEQEDGSFHYAMGFDDQTRDDDSSFNSEGITVIVSALSLKLIEGTTLDFVQLEDGEYNFVFMNPNDPNYRPPPSLAGGELPGGGGE